MSKQEFREVKYGDGDGENELKGYYTPEVEKELKEKHNIDIESELKEALYYEFYEEKKRANNESKQYTGTGKLLTTSSPSGNMLYGDKTDKERKDEQQEYKDKTLNEDK